MTSMDVLFNVPVVNRAKARQVPIMWTDNDEEGVLYLHKYALVISVVVASKKFEHILVDMGSSVDVLFKSTFDEIGITSLKLKNTSTSLKGCGGGKTNSS